MSSSEIQNESVNDRMLTSRSLLQRARSRDEGAWRQLIELYAPLVYFWCRRLGVPEQEIADLVQDVFRAVLTGLDGFRKERPGGTFRGWLRTVTRTKVIDARRKNRRVPTAIGGSDAQWRWDHLPETVEPDEDERQAEKELFLRAVESVREFFDQQTWQAFWRTVVDSASAADVAADLGMTPGAVRVAKCRVLQRLRRQLGDVE